MKLLQSSIKSKINTNLLIWVLISLSIGLLLYKSYSGFIQYRYLRYGFDSVRILGYTRELFTLGVIDPYSSNRLGLPLIAGTVASLFKLLPSQTMVAPYWLVNMVGPLLMSYMVWHMVKHKMAAAWSMLFISVLFPLASVNDSHFFYYIIVPLRLILLKNLLKERKNSSAKSLVLKIFYIAIVFYSHLTYQIGALIFYGFDSIILFLSLITERKKLSNLKLIAVIDILSFLGLYVLFAATLNKLGFIPTFSNFSYFAKHAYSLEQTELPLNFVITLILTLLLFQTIFTLIVIFHGKRKLPYFLVKNYSIYKLSLFTRLIRLKNSITRILESIRCYIYALIKKNNRRIPYFIVLLIFTTLALFNAIKYRNLDTEVNFMTFLKLQDAFSITIITIVLGVISLVVLVPENIVKETIFKYIIAFTIPFLVLYWFEHKSIMIKYLFNERVFFFAQMLIIIMLARALKVIVENKDNTLLVLCISLLLITSTNTIRKEYLFDGSRPALKAMDWLSTQPNFHNSLVHADYGNYRYFGGHDNFDSAYLLPSSYSLNTQQSLGKCDKREVECMNKFVEFVKTNQADYVIVESDVYNEIFDKLKQLGLVVYDDRVKIIKIDKYSEIFQ